MRAILILLSLSMSLFLTAFVCRIAALMAQQGSPYADTVGYAGLGIGAVLFVVMSIVSWRLA